MLLDLTNKNISGMEAETALDSAGVTVNKNSIPYDKKPAVITSGIRIGTPIVTSRNMKESEMVVIADLISNVLDYPKNNSVIKRTSDKVKSMCRKFPVYEGIEI